MRSETRWQRFWNWYFGFGSELHRQTYYGWREYPAAFRHTAILGFLCGMAFASCVWVFARANS